LFSRRVWLRTSNPVRPTQPRSGMLAGSLRSERAESHPLRQKNRTGPLWARFVFLAERVWGFDQSATNPLFSSGAMAKRSLTDIGSSCVRPWAPGTRRTSFGHFCGIFRLPIFLECVRDASPEMSCNADEDVIHGCIKTRFSRGTQRSLSVGVVITLDLPRGP